MTLSRAIACDRLSMLGLYRKDVHRIVDQVQKWVKSCGEEWTVARLKSLKVGLVNQLASDDSKLTIPWVKTRGGRPAGPFRCLWRGDLSKHKRRTLALNALMQYSSFVSSEITPQQRRKFEGSVTAAPTEVFRSRSSKHSVHLSVHRVRPSSSVHRVAGVPREGRLVGTCEGAHWLAVMTGVSLVMPRRVAGFTDLGSLSPERRVPVWSLEKGRPMTVQESDIASWFPDNIREPTVIRAARVYPDLYQAMWQDKGVSDWLKRGPRPYGEPGIGRTGFIQEPGYKLRAVANPNRIHQTVLRPFGDSLFKALRALDADCTFDQSKGVDKVQEWLKAGHVVSSIDLSDATNMFPLEISEAVVKDLAHNQRERTAAEKWLAYYRDCSRGPWWHTTAEGRSGVIRWTRGQPLGLQPSFALFALSHHAMVYCAWSQVRAFTHAEVEGKPYDGYVVLGDDVVIRDHDVAREYCKMMGALGCPIATDKTLVSSRLAEFAGKVIAGDAVYHPVKWREPSDRSFIDYARNVGYKATRCLKPRQRHVIDVLSEVPEEYGGLGWNPKGLSMARRVAQNIATIRRLERGLSVEPIERVETRNFGRRLVLGMTTTLGLDNTKPWLRWLAPPVIAQEPDRTPAPPSEPVPLVVNRFIQPVEESWNVSGQANDYPIGYVPKQPITDPRGPSTLAVMEGKLGIKPGLQQPAPEHTPRGGGRER